MELAVPLASLASLVLIALAFNRLQNVPISKGFVSAAFGLVAFAGAAALVGWAVEDSSRLMGLLVVMIGVVIFALVRVGRQQSRRRPPTVEPQDRSEFL